MNILRWLMKHPIMLAWLLAIVAILLNFGMSNKSGEHGEGTIAGHGQEAAAQAAVHEAGTATAQQATEVAATTHTGGAQTGGEPAQAVVAGVQQPQTGAAPAQGSVPAEGNPAIAQQQPAAGASADQPADLLRAAREAYWSNELDNAVGFYTTLLQQSPASIEYKGELANVYWKQGNAKQAATLFAEIAPKLAEQGRVTEAFNMKLYVDMVDPELAKQIDAALNK